MQTNLLFNRGNNMNLVCALQRFVLFSVDTMCFSLVLVYGNPHLSQL